ncbi:MAG: orotate phosphoribosyltransferase [Chloroflexi bacterium]|nr:orotate phosphoribosyltransferase [Chloroflexota bacterium]
MSEPLRPLRLPLSPPADFPVDPVDPLDRIAVSRRIEGLLRATGALQQGHFLLKSGRHGDHYLEKWSLLQHPSAAAEIAHVLAAQSLEVVHGMGSDIDLVVGPTTGGVLLAYEIGRLLGVRGLFAEEVRGTDGTPRREFRRGFHIPPRSRVLLVDDILTTGGSLQALLPPLYAAGAHPVAAAVVASRTPGLTAIEAEGREPIPLVAGITLDLPTFDATACPRCAAGEPIGAPGSSGR